jgi:hypothetical protein
MENETRLKAEHSRGVAGTRRSGSDEMQCSMMPEDWGMGSCSAPADLRCGGNHDTGRITTAERRATMGPNSRWLKPVIRKGDSLTSQVSNLKPDQRSVELRSANRLWALMPPYIFDFPDCTDQTCPASRNDSNHDWWWLARMESLRTTVMDWRMGCPRLKFVRWRPLACRHQSPFCASVVWIA